MAERLESRTLDKAITVLEKLGHNGPSSLHQLYLATGFPKSTLRRLLATLVRRSLVRQSPNDDLYRSNVALPLVMQSEISVQAARLIEIAFSHMCDLTRLIRWPSDLHMYNDGKMRIIESTRTFSPIQVYRARVDLEVNIFASACGRAYLSTLKDQQIENIIEKTGNDPRFGLATFGMTADDLLTEIATTRSLGYARRLSGYHGERQVDDQLRAISVPIKSNNTTFGTLNICWNRRYMSTLQFAEKFSGNLLETVKKISADLDALSQ
jgi:IclR family mhp operon transcriptional activator